MEAPEVILLLTSDLLVTRISRGKIKPEYAAFDSENLELARLLIETFEQHVGKTYGDLLAELEGYEEMNYRLIRGLSQLLGRRAVIETVAAVDPSAAREAVFEACGGIALSPAERKEALQKAAKKLSISIPELEKALWADLEENQILKEFHPLSPAELLRQYNISLTQTLLFRAVDMDIWIRGGFQKILWKILRSGLMYALEDSGTGEEVHLHMEGPASLFKMSERYGNSFARLFPALLKSGGWNLKAGILHKGYQGKRILEFILDGSEEAFRLSPEAARYPEGSPSASEIRIEEGREEYETGEEISEKPETPEIPATEAEAENITYDSTLEKEFGNLSLGSWEMDREPTILKAGKYAFVPDFALKRDEMKVYVEIVGFWTSEYLEKKINKLKDVKEPVLLLINRKLKCSEKDFPAQDVIFFEKKIPATEVMQVLRKYEGQRISEDREKLQEMEIPLSGEMISLEEVSKEKGIMTEALKEVLSERLEGAEDYVLLENYVLHRELLERIDRELEKPGVETYANAVKVFESFGLDRSLYYPVLDQLGYKVSWCGLSEEDARVKKVKGKD